MDYSHEKPEPLQPITPPVGEAANLKTSSVLPMSQAAIAAFIFGTLQTVMTIMHIAVRSNLMDIAGNMSGRHLGSGSVILTIPATVDSNMLLMLTCANAIGIAGIMTGLVGTRATSRKKDKYDGLGLAMYGLFLSLICVFIGLTPAVLQWILG